jgi:UDP-2-acetamido-2,6-beta-L-arabino-hexul-4-ose reductase
VNVLVTGTQGFVGKNLCTVLQRCEEVVLSEYDVQNTPPELDAALRQADIIIHLAGVNRPQNVDEFATGNAGFTEEICARLRAMRRRPKIVLASSIQASYDNPYGTSKRLAEEALEAFCAETGADGVIFRLKNLFGKWCRPNYNSVTATFCANIAHDLPIQITDPAKEIELTYIDDVVAAFLAELMAHTQVGCRLAEPLASRIITLGALAEAIHTFHAHRKTLHLPEYSDPFMRALYATYLSYLEDDQYGYQLSVQTDNRGSLAEFIKAPSFGQIFVSRTKPGITRGNHFHHTKTEKFLVVQGEGLIRLRQIDSETIIEFRVSGEDYCVVDIPPGYAHSIENVGNGEMVTLFWSIEVFDPVKPDTWFEAVICKANCKA